MNIIEQSGGSLERQSDTTHVVSMWTIPGGYDHANANPITIFYNNEHAAHEIAERYKDLPEMAVCIALEEYERILGKTSDCNKRLVA